MVLGGIAMKCQNVRWVALLVAILAGLTLQPGVLISQDAAMPSLIALDPDSRVVKSVRLTDGNVVTSARFEKIPDSMVLSPDGTRLVVFHEPSFFGETWTKDVDTEARADGTAIRRPKEPHSASIIDTREMTLVGRIDDVGWNASAIRPWVFTQPMHLIYGLHEGPTGAWSEDGKRYTLLAWGRRENPPELVQIDVPGARVAARLPLACGTAQVHPLLEVTPGKVAGLLCSGTLMLVDLTDLSASKPVRIPGSPWSVFPSPEGQLLYVLAVAGDRIWSVHAISPVSKAVSSSWPVGSGITKPILDFGRGRWLVGGIAAGSRTSGLFEIRNGGVKRVADFSDEVGSLQLTKTRLYALGRNSVQVLDADSFRPVGIVQTPARKTGEFETVSGAFAPPALLALDPNEARGFLSYRSDDELSVLDLKTFKITTTLDLVSGWKNFLVSLAASAVVSANAQIRWTSMGMPGPAPPSAMMVAYSADYSTLAVDPTGKTLSVLDAKKLEIIDLATNRKRSVNLAFEPGYFEFVPVGENQTIVVHGRKGSKDSVRASRLDWEPKDILIDTVTGKTLIGPSGQCFYFPDRRVLVQHDSENVLVRDPSTLAVVRKVTGFKRIRQVLFGPATATPSGR
jgi:hypothetical protein